MLSKGILINYHKTENAKVPKLVKVIARLSNHIRTKLSCYVNVNVIVTKYQMTHLPKLIRYIKSETAIKNIKVKKIEHTYR